MQGFIFLSRHSCGGRNPGLIQILFVLFVEKVPKRFKGQKLGQFYLLTFLYSWTLNSLPLKNPFLFSYFYIESEWLLNILK